ncbi:MAG: Ig-like domain-containing protein [Prevotella sp.]|nr:Ig-like domain-containing protein [Prevotella sp.]
MKKLLLLTMVLAGTLGAMAYDYPYLTFKSSDGTMKSVSVESLVMTFSNGQLVAASSSANDAFVLADLSKMYFSQTDETTETQEPVANGLAFSSTTATAKMGETFETPTLENPYNLALTWTSSDEGVATVDQTGAVTLVAAGTTVITATFAGNDDYEAGSVSYTLTVEKADPVANGLAFSRTTATAKIGETFETPTLENPYNLTLTWTSSDEGVATVDQTAAVTLVAAGTTVITATFAGNDDYEAGSVSYTLTVEKADPGSNGLSFSATTATAKMGEEFNEPALSNPYNLSLSWTSSDESIATVDQTGAVTLVAAGTTVITATFAGNDDYEAGSVSYTLTVEKADPGSNGLLFSATTATAKMGEEFNEPALSNPYNLSLSWTSSDEGVATVDQTGTVTLVAAGTTVITATFAGNDDYEAGSVSYTLTVEKADPVANGLAFSSTTATAKMGETFETPTLENPYNLTLTWTSSDEGVATVDQTGAVTLVAAGTTVITATFAGNDDYEAGSVSYTLTVEKADPVANGLAFSSTTATAKMGESFETPTLENPYNLTLTWTSSDEGVATVDQTGTVTLVAAGTTVITAAFAGNDDYEAGSVSYTLTVEEAVINSIPGMNTHTNEVLIYNLSGKYLGRYDSLQKATAALPNGVYIINIAGENKKISIRK